jgi:malate dehydrogenase (oxaloacetate-decarboxylating)(NADP+)
MNYRISLHSTHFIKMSVSNHLVKNLKNVQAILNNRLNKGLAFTNEERKQLGIQGLFPAQVLTIERQEQMVLANLKRLDKDLDKYVYLMHLLDRNEKLFYKVLSSNVEEIMPIVYTPTVGEACIKYDLIFNQPK